MRMETEKTVKLQKTQYRLFLIMVMTAMVLLLTGLMSRTAQAFYEDRMFVAFGVAYNTETGTQDPVSYAGAFVLLNSEGSCFVVTDISVESDEAEEYILIDINTSETFNLGSAQEMSDYGMLRFEFADDIPDTSLMMEMERAEQDEAATMIYLREDLTGDSVSMQITSAEKITSGNTDVIVLDGDADASDVAVWPVGIINSNGKMVAIGTSKGYIFSLFSDIEEFESSVVEDGTAYLYSYDSNWEYLTGAVAVVIDAGNDDLMVLTGDSLYSPDAAYYIVETEDNVCQAAYHHTVDGTGLALFYLESGAGDISGDSLIYTMASASIGETATIIYADVDLNILTAEICVTGSGEFSGGNALLEYDLIGTLSQARCPAAVLDEDGNCIGVLAVEGEIGSDILIFEDLLDGSDTGSGADADSDSQTSETQADTGTKSRKQ